MGKIILFLVCVGLIGSISASEQSAAVKGRLMCGDKPAAGVKVKLIDDDTGPNFDDTLDTTETDSSGKFYLAGTEDEPTNIDLYLKIYHNCMDGFKLCDRRWKFEIPDVYINKGKVANITKTLDVGTMNLMLIMEEEERDCWN